MTVYKQNNTNKNNRINKVVLSEEARFDYEFIILSEQIKYPTWTDCLQEAGLDWNGSLKINGYDYRNVNKQFGCDVYPVLDGLSDVDRIKERCRFHKAREQADAHMAQIYRNVYAMSGEYQRKAWTIAEKYEEPKRILDAAKLKQLIEYFLDDINQQGMQIVGDTFNFHWDDYIRGGTASGLICICKRKACFGIMDVWTVVGIIEEQFYNREELESDGWLREWLKNKVNEEDIWTELHAKGWNDWVTRMREYKELQKLILKLEGYNENDD